MCFDQCNRIISISVYKQCKTRTTKQIFYTKTKLALKTQQKYKCNVNSAVKKTYSNKQIFFQIIVLLKCMKISEENRVPSILGCAL